MSTFDRSAPPLDPPGAPARPVARPRSTTRDYLEAILVALLCTIVIRTFVVQAFRIPSGSMEDTLAIGDYLFVNKVLYGARIPLLDRRLPGIRAPRPGDVIVFRYPRDPSKDYIKRLIAIGGQVVEIRDREVWVDGVRVAEPYAKFEEQGLAPGDRGHVGPLLVPPGYLYVMGDNRDLSHDSRGWGFLDRDLVIGRASTIYWSWNPERKLLRWLPMPRWSRIGTRVR
jgi:signal peptidase I